MPPLSDFILQYYQQESFKNLKKLYINLSDSKINSYQDLNNLESFCHKKNIEVLILDSYTPEFPLPNLPYITLISQFPYELPHFQTQEMPPITFKEYLQIHKQTPHDSFNHYLKYGNLFEAETLNEYKMARSSRHGTVETNPTRNHEVAGSIPGLIQ